MGKAPQINESDFEGAAGLNPADTDFVAYVLNVGDGDSIVLQFPAVDGVREFAVIDSNNGLKTQNLLHNLGLPDGARLRFVCATHPHVDHIRGLSRILTRFDVEEFWDSGFRYTSATYNKTIKEVENRNVQFLRVTSGFETWVNGVHLTVLSPSLSLRNRYDTYGVDPNNASIVLRLEYPDVSPEDEYPQDAAEESAESNTRAVILGGDAQADAWSRVMEEFPHLDKDTSNWARQIKARQGRQPLLCDVLKVAHHCSKHGINLELVERMGDRYGSGPVRGPTYLVSSCAQDQDSNHGFPHGVAQAIIREVRDPLAKAGGTHVAEDDYENGIHYTCQRLGNDTPAGSIAVVLHMNGDDPDVYRLMDGAGDDDVDLSVARRAKKPAQ